MSDTNAPHLVSLNLHPPSNSDVIVDPSLACHPPDGLPGLASTNKRSVASWTRPHISQVTTTAVYNLTPTHAAWLCSYDPASLPDLGAT